MLSINEIRNQLKQSSSHHVIDKDSKKQFSYSVIPLKSKSLDKIEVYWDHIVNHKIIKRVLLREFSCKNINSTKFIKCFEDAINLYLKNIKNS